MKKARRVATLIKQEGAAHPYLLAFIIGLLYYSFCFSWLKGVRATDLISNARVAKILGFSALLIMATFYALGAMLFVWAYRQLKLNLKQGRAMWLAPALLVCCEALTSLGFSVLVLGKGSRIGDYWHFGTVGMWLVPTKLIYLSRWGGIYLLSYALGVCIFGLLVSIRKRNWQYFVWPVVAVGIASLSGYVVYRTPQGKQVSVTTVTMKSGLDSIAPTDALLRTVRQIKRPSDVVVLPEYSQYWLYDQASEAKAMRAALKSPNGLVIHSVRVRTATDNKNYNYVTYADAQGKVLQQYQKWFIVPGGEYFPDIYKGFMSLSHNQALVGQFDKLRGIVPATNKERPFQWQGTTYGALACSAVNVPELYRDITNQGATVLVNVASVSSVGLSKSYHIQSFNQSRLHAVANARPFVQSARGGYGYIIDANGRTIVKNTSLDDGYLQATITANQRKTVYTYLGNWPVLVSAALLVVGYLQLPEHRRKIKTLQA